MFKIIMYTVGVDIGGTNIKIGLVLPDGNIAASSSIPTVPEKGYVLTVDDICREIKALSNGDAVRAIGVGIPGIADSAAGMVRLAVNLRWKNVMLAAEFHKHFQVPVRLSNDANCAALGEQRFGSGKGHRDMIFITIGTGVGSGIIIKGRLIEGNRSAGGEAGHMLLKMNGEKCGCGRRGCWEAYASATALIKQTQRAAAKAPESILANTVNKTGAVNGKTAFTAAEAGCEVGKAVVRQYIKYVSEGLINLTNILHPEVFVIGGGVSHEGDGLILPLEHAVNEYIRCSGMYPEIAVRRASLGNKAGLLGAAALVL